MKTFLEDFAIPLGLLACLVLFVCSILNPPQPVSSAIVVAPVQARPLIPEREEEDEAPILTGDLATPGQYAVNHWTTNAP